TVVSPVVVPLFGSRSAAATNRRLLTAQISRLAKRRAMTKPILWIAIPTAVEIIGQLNESLVIYHVSDKYDANTMDHATDPAHIRKLHERAIDAADLILYSSRKLIDEAERGREKSYLLEQAVDFDHWAQINNGRLTMADAVARIPRPRIGYFGAIEPWLVDQDLIKRAARERPDWNWIFIGTNRAVWKSRNCRTFIFCRRSLTMICPTMPLDSMSACCRGTPTFRSRATARRSKCASTSRPANPS